MMRVYLDDERIPRFLSNFDRICRNYAEMLNIFHFYGCPSYISFDHDLGEDEPTGYDVAKAMIEKDMDEGGAFIPKDFKFHVHSANPVGARNINLLLLNYLRKRNEDT
jgi:hypothetical protein